MSLHRRGKSKNWWAVVYVPRRLRLPGEGPQRWVDTDTTDKNVAKDREVEEIKKLRSPRLVPSGSIPWEDFKVLFMKDYWMVNNKHGSEGNAYRKLKAFESYCSPSSSFDLNPIVINDLIRRMKEKKRGNNSIRTYVCFLRNMGKWGQGKGFVKTDFDYYKEVKLPKFEKKEKIFHELAELDLMRAQFPKERLLTRLIVTLLFNTGMRPAEMENCTIDDFDLLNNRVRVSFKDGWTTKDSEERVLPLFPEALEVYKEWINQSWFKAIKPKYLLVKPNGKLRGRRGIWYIVTSFLRRCGIKKGNSRSMRHTYGTHMSGEFDTRTLQNLMGHSLLSTTQGYTHMRNEALKGAHEKSPFISKK